MEPQVTYDALDTDKPGRFRQFLNKTILNKYFVVWNLSSISTFPGAFLAGFGAAFTPVGSKIAAFFTPIVEKTGLFLSTTWETLVELIL